MFMIRTHEQVIIDNKNDSGAAGRAAPLNDCVIRFRQVITVIAVIIY